MMSADDQTEHLSKRYGALMAVDDLSSKSARRSARLLGPKARARRHDADAHRVFAPTSGHASVYGHDVESGSDRGRSCIGYLPEGAPLYGEMTAPRLPEFIADLARAARREARTASTR